MRSRRVAWWRLGWTALRSHRRLLAGGRSLSRRSGRWRGRGAEHGAAAEGRGAARALTAAREPNLEVLHRRPSLRSNLGPADGVFLRAETLIDLLLQLLPSRAADEPRRLGERGQLALALGPHQLDNVGRREQVHAQDDEHVDATVGHPHRDRLAIPPEHEAGGCVEQQRAARGEWDELALVDLLGGRDRRVRVGRAAEGVQHQRHKEPEAALGQWKDLTERRRAGRADALCDDIRGHHAARWQRPLLHEVNDHTPR